MRNNKTQLKGNKMNTKLLLDLQLFVAGKMGLAQFRLDQDIEKGWDTEFNQDKVNEATALLDRINQEIRGELK